MQFVTRDLPEEWESLYVIPISDAHIGDPRFNLHKLQGYLEWILSRPNAYTVLNGDILDAAIEGSVGDTYDATMTTGEAIKYAKQLFMPLKDRILGVTEGNHEARITRKTGVSPMDMLAAFLDVPFDASGLLLKVRFGKQKNGKKLAYSIYATHGHGGGRTIGGKANNLGRLGSIVIADCYTQGHIHTAMTYQDAIYIPDLRNNNIMLHRRSYVSSGSFVDWGGYAQRQSYTPGRLGSARIRLDGRVRDCHVSI